MFACCFQWFGWRKASKCEKLIKRAQCRLKLLKSKRQSIAKQSRQDVAMLIKAGREDLAFDRVDQLIRDERIVSTYELLEAFCEFIDINLSYIQRRKDRPNDINEAISSVIFASARCGELPELFELRILFANRYGQRYVITAVELLPGNFVSLQIQENLSLDPVSEDIKKKLVYEIAQDAHLLQDKHAPEYNAELQQQAHEKEDTELVVLDTADRVEPLNGIDKEEKPIALVDSLNVIDKAEKAIVLVDSELSTKNFFDPPHHDKIPMSPVSTSMTSSIVHHSSPDVLDSPMEMKSDKAANISDTNTPGAFEVVALGAKGSRRAQRRMVAASSSESLPQLHEEMIVYLDDNDTQDLKSSVKKGPKNQEQRALKLKSVLPPATEIVEESCSVDCMDRFDPRNKRSLRRRTKAVDRRYTRRAVHLESSSTKDIGTAIYYDIPGKKFPPPRSRFDSTSKQQKKSMAHNREQLERKHKQTQPLSRLHDCYLNEPCYAGTGDDTDLTEVPSWKHERLGDTVIQQGHLLRNHDSHTYDSPTVEESNSELEWRTFLRRLGQRISASETRPYGRQEYGPRTKYRMVFENTGEETRPNYLRSMTAPWEQKKQNDVDDLRSRSLSAQSPKHVHPKLPDCDDVEATFRALKKQHFCQKHY